MAKKYEQKKLVKEVVKDDKKAKGGKLGTAKEDRLLGQAARDERKLKADAKSDTKPTAGDKKFAGEKIKKSYAKGSKSMKSKGGKGGSGC